MNQLLIEKKMLKRASKHSISSGVILILAGLLGIFLPAVMSLTVSLFAGWLLVFGGIVGAYHVYKAYSKKMLAWLKPFILILTGVLVLFYPLSGVIALGLLLAIYLFVDAFASFTFAFEFHPFKGWGWTFLNGLISLVLAIVVLLGWPFASLWLVGLFVGFSLFFDGLVYLMIGVAAHKSTLQEE